MQRLRRRLLADEQGTTVTHASVPVPRTRVLLPRRRYTTLLCFAGFFLLGVTAATLGPTLVDLANKLSIPLQNGGILRAIRQVGTLVAVLAGGWLLDQRGGRAVLMPGGLLMALGLMAMVLAQDLSLVLVACFLLGGGCISS